MNHFPIKRRSQKSGLPPGSLIHIGERRLDRTKLTIIDYDEEGVREKSDATVEECLSYKDKKSTTWIDVEGIHDVGVLENLGKAFNIHPLTLEDILNTDQRPKMEDHDEYVYIVLKMMCIDDAKKEIVADQVSIILGKNYVISFQEGVLDVFDPLRKRIREGKGRMRKSGADFLAYSLVDAIVDNFFVVLEKFGDQMEDLEDELVHTPDKRTIQKIHRLKRDMLYLRRSIWPLRELASGLERTESGLIGDYIQPYLKDVYDHTVYLVDTIETFREMLSGMLDIYLSSINNRMNEIMKVLTIIATLFMPLTFICSVYGMNFKYMPELDWRFGYPLTLIIMVCVVIVMLMFFRRKKWI